MKVQRTFGRGSVRVYSVVGGVSLSYWIGATKSTKFLFTFFFSSSFSLCCCCCCLGNVLSSSQIQYDIFFTLPHIANTLFFSFFFLIALNHCFHFHKVLTLNSQCKIFGIFLMKVILTLLILTIIFLVRVDSNGVTGTNV